MDVVSIILIGIGLAMDCLAVSTTKGLQMGQWCNRALWMALLFGLFQGGMPLIGYYTGLLFAQFFSQFAPWIALVLLAFIGGKMIVESCHRDESCPMANPHATDWRWRTLLVLAIATSIDALATGVIFIPCPDSLWIGVSIIALCSLLFSLIGYLIGVYVGCKFRLNVELIGGIILVLIGLKIWVQGIWM